MSFAAPRRLVPEEPKESTREFFLGGKKNLAAGRRKTANQKKNGCFFFVVSKLGKNWDLYDFFFRFIISCDVCKVGFFQICRIFFKKNKKVLNLMTNPFCTRRLKNKLGTCLSSDGFLENGGESHTC